MRRKGVTLVEMLVVMAIVASLSAISYPVIVRSKEEAKRTKVKIALKQLFYALELYRSDHEPSSNSGTASQMGLPNVDQYHQQIWDKYETLYPLNEHPNSDGSIVYYPRDPSACISPEVKTSCMRLVAGWEQYTIQNFPPILVGDFQFTTDCSSVMIPDCLKTGYGVNLDGSIAKRTSSGMHFLPEWWQRI